MLQPVRVCFVVENLLPAGTELWIVRLIEQLDRSRVTPFLCLLDGDGEMSRGLEPKSCDVLRLGMKSICSRTGIKSAQRFRQFLRSNRIDIVQVHHADPTYFAVPIAKLAGTKKVLQTKYDVGYWLKGRDLWLHRMFRRLVDLTVANCEACREASIAQEWAPRDGVVVVDNGIPLDRLSQISALQLPTDETVHVGMVCNLRPVKAPTLFVQAAAKIVEHRSNVVFHIAGGGEMRDELQSQIKTLSIEHQFKLHGVVTDIPGFLEQMHITVLCSRSEGLPHAVLEYMAAGRATVVTAVGGNTELIEHDRTGQLVPSGDVSALARAIERYIADPAFANRMGRNAREHVAARHSFEAMAERFAAFYSGLLPGRTSLATKANDYVTV